MRNEKLRKCLKQIGRELILPAFLGIVGGLATSDIADKYILEDNLRNSRAEYIDRDNLPDLIVGKRIYLANPINDGVVYNRLENSDRYRITF